MTKLDEIVAAKRKEVAKAKERVPIATLEDSIFFPTQVVSLKHYLLRQDKDGVIAEIKRRSPSRGVINPHISVEALSIGYMQGGASALSVLTDKEYFGGSAADLRTARAFNYCPILRKDFIIDEYQLIEAKSIGADAVLLIAAVLTPNEISAFATAAGKLGLEVLLEVHDEKELDRSLCPGIHCVGVNNRDLRTMQVSLETSRNLCGKIPKELVKIAESGIKSAADAFELLKAGFNGFLIGELFMSHSRPELACSRFIKELRSLKQSDGAQQ